MIYINARFRAQQVTGVQRYGMEIADRLNGICTEIQPQKMTSGVQGHVWEQAVLPFLARKGVLWNPCATGPVLKKSVVTIHDLAFLEHPEWFSNEYVRLSKFVVPRVIKNAHHVVCVSEYTRSKVIEHMGIPFANTTIVPSCPPNIVSGLSEEQELLFKQKHNISGCRYILSVCSLEPRKNLSRLLRAWRMVQSKLGKDYILVLAGGRGKSNVFANSGIDEQAEGIVTTGYVSDSELRFLYEHAEAFIYPSLYEGFGLPPLEAMQYGCPVVVSRVTSIPEVVEEAGLYVDPYSEESIAEGIERICSNETLRADLKNAGQTQVRKYSWDQNANAIKQILLAFQ